MNKAKKSIRIVIISNYDLYGGSSIAAYNLHTTLLKNGYKSLTTDKEQRDSFKQHYLKAIIDTLSPQDAIRAASGGESVGMLGGSALEEQDEIEVTVTQTQVSNTNTRYK